MTAQVTGNTFQCREIIQIGQELSLKHTHMSSKGPQIVPAGCYDCMSVPLSEMKVCPQEGGFFPPLSINTNVTPFTITTLQSKLRDAKTQNQSWAFTDVSNLQTASLNQSPI